MNLERTVHAALAAKRSTFALAEALALDIPKMENENGNVSEALREASEKIVEAGGEDYAPRHLRELRQTAIWVMGVRPSAQFAWRDGSAFTAHKIAARAEMDYAEFAKVPRTANEVRRMAGYRVSNTPIGVEHMSAVERTDLMRELAEADPDSMATVAEEKARKDFTDAVAKMADERTPAKEMKDPSRSDTLTLEFADLRDLVSRNIKFNELVTSRWSKRMVEGLPVAGTGGYAAIAKDLRTVAGIYNAIAAEADTHERAVQDRKANAARS